jgi:hypothetical protein
VTGFAYSRGANGQPRGNEATRYVAFRMICVPYVLRCDMPAAEACGPAPPAGQRGVT